MPPLTSGFAFTLRDGSYPTLDSAGLALVAPFPSLRAMFCIYIALCVCLTGLTLAGAGPALVDGLFESLFAIFLYSHRPLPARRAVLLVILRALPLFCLTGLTLAGAGPALVDVR